jgi:hypothetical protein
VDVALYAPVIVRRYFPWIACSLLSVPLRCPRNPSGVCHRLTPYVSAGRTIVLYTATPVLIDEPYVEPVIVRSALTRCTDFASIALRWGFYLNVESSCTPKTLISDFRLICWPSSRSFAFILNFFAVRLKYINSYFSGQNWHPCFRAHASHLSCILFSVRQFCSVLSLNVRMLISSTNLVALVRS